MITLPKESVPAISDPIEELLGKPLHRVTDLELQWIITWPDHIPFGYCQCGCGRKTTIPKNDCATNKRVKGFPLRYISGHNSRVSPPHSKGGKSMDTGGYIMILKPEHPRANQKGYIGEHILVAEKALGKYLPINAIVHHVNGNNADNQPCNLVVCQDRAYHNTIHRRENAFRACGHADWRKCRFCQTWDSPDNLHINKDGGYHNSCAAKYLRNKRQGGTLR